ncbi:MAG: isoprenylcysteine carboxylmethyltransferase family protein [Candidatus Cloacimonetes bacterium]|nr:isoprenylcysteine carboxylmethyltransferase family protein [Candidatus Cloacimonadota bacterium]
MNLELKIPPVIVVLVAMVLTYSLRVVDPSGVLPLPFGKEIFLISISLGILVALMGVYSFRKNSTTVNPLNPSQSSTLVCGGIYQLTRNPMYLGMAFIVVGFAWYSGHYMGFIISVLFKMYMSKYQIKPEEAILSKIFHEDYKEYCEKVRRWL